MAWNFDSSVEAIVASEKKTVYWLFEVDDTYFWSTKYVPDSVYNSQEYTFKVIADSFRGFQLNRLRAEDGAVAPSTLSFTIHNKDNTLSPSTFDDSVVVVRCVMDDGNGPEEIIAHTFAVSSEPFGYEETIKFECEDVLQHYLDGEWPMTALISSLSPMEAYQQQSTTCVPVIYGNAYIPVQPIYNVDHMYYVLGLAGPTYTVDEVQSPPSYPKSTWTEGDSSSSTYTMDQSTKTIDSVNYRVFQPLIAQGNCGLFRNGQGFDYIRCNYEESTTSSMTSPADVIADVLESFGVPAALLDTGGGSSFESAATAYTTWGLSWYGGIYNKLDKKKVLSSLLTMCHSTLRVTDKIELHPLSKTSQFTVDTTYVLRSRSKTTSFKVERKQTNETDSGYVAWSQSGDPQDQKQTTLCPAKGSTTDFPTSESFDAYMVHDSQDAQRIGTLKYQRRLLKDRAVSFNSKSSMIGVQPDDVITMSDAKYGGTYAVVVDSVVVNKDCSLGFKASKYSVALDDFLDITPSTVTVEENDVTSIWDYVYQGPVSEPTTGDGPTTFEIGDGTDNILSYDGESMHFSGSITVGNETFGDAGFQVEYNEGNPRLYIGDGDTNYFKYEDGAVTLGGVDVDAGDFTNSSLDGGEFNTNFIFTAQTNGSTQVSLPLVSDGSYDFTVDWGDDDTDDIVLWSDTAKTHTYSVAGVYEITISGTECIGWRYDGNSYAQYVRVIKSWGMLRLVNHTQGAYFAGCRYMTITANNHLDLTGITNLNYMFNDCEDIVTVPNMEDWDMSNITDMTGMFYECDLFNQPLNGWDTSSVEKMGWLFRGCHAFNQDLDKWDTSNVDTMTVMFGYCYQFDGNVSTWDVSGVASLNSVFYSTNFTGDTSLWDVSNCTDMTGLFYGAELTGEHNLNDWDVSNVTNMSQMFQSNSQFNGDLSSWDTGKVTNFNSMFSGCYRFNSDISNWDTTGVTAADAFEEMFRNCQDFNQPIGEWDIGSVTDLSEMFSGALSFNQDLDDWDVSTVTNFFEMFRDARDFNGSLSGWTMSATPTVTSMFRNAASFNQSINDWVGTSNITNMSQMFWYASSYNKSMSNWDVSNVSYFNSTFANATAFNGDIDDWTLKTSSAVTCDRMFYASAFDGDLSGWDVQAVTDFDSMFGGCADFNCDLSSWDVSNATTMTSMFYGCGSFNSNISGWTPTSCARFDAMFQLASSFNQNLATWDVTNVTVSSGIGAMFYASGLSSTNYSNILIGWEGQSVNNSISLNVGTLTYNSSAATAHANLIADHSWSITDGGEA